MPDANMDYVIRKLKHIKAVQRFAGRFIDILREQCKHHDEDKIQRAKRGEEVSKEEHYLNNRHHWTCSRIEEVTLIDLLETLADCLATVEEKGEPIIILTQPQGLDECLKRIIENTVSLLEKHEIKYSSLEEFMDDKEIQNKQPVQNEDETENNLKGGDKV